MKTIVLVYLGKSIPKYVFLNLEYLLKNFSDSKIILLSDYQTQLNLATKIGVESALVPHPEDYSALKPEGLSHDLSFRDGFWYKTISRFNALSFFSETCPDKAFLHLEADVLIMPNFPMSEIFKIQTNLAYPLSSIENAAASIFYVRNYSAIQEFIDFAEKEIVVDGFATDMTILARYALKNPNSITLLPTAPNNSRAFTSIVQQCDYSKFSSNLDQFGGLFDANTWGQFLTGEDERNTAGLRRVFHHIPSHAIDTRNFNFKYDKSLKVLLEGTSVDLFALHIHSKEKALFDRRRSQKYLRRLISKSESGTVHQIKLLVLIRLLPNTLKKLFLRNFKNG
jgi:hypothetical protein